MKSVVAQKYVDFEPNLSKENYVHRSFEEVEIGIAPEHTKHLPNIIQAKRKKYFLRHHATRTFHACQVDTLLSMATEIS